VRDSGEQNYTSRESLEYNDTNWRTFGFLSLSLSPLITLERKLEY
jgi:hypothetical protein